MKKISILLALALVVALTLPAVAEVEEVTVGGSIQIRGQYLGPGPADDVSGFGEEGRDADSLWADDENSALDWITQRTRINVEAKLSGSVRAFVELQSFDTWGVDTNSNDPKADDFLPDGEEDYVDDGDMEAFDLFWDEYEDFEMFAGQGNDNVQLYQAYIEMNDIGDYPVRLRIGRQELVFGREWLVGNNDAGVNFSGLAFDAVRLTYAPEDWQLDLWWSKLIDMSSLTFLIEDSGDFEEDADIDFYGAYATYKGFENMEIDAYFLFVRDAQQGSDFLWGSDVENLELYTVGGRIAGCMELGPGMFDYNLEAAFQFGDSNLEVVDDDGGDYEGWAINAMAGFEFTDVAMSPRIEAEYAYFSGPDGVLDDNDMSMFLRLFSDVHYGEINLGQNLDAKMTNMHILRLGASAEPMEKLTVSVDFYGFWLAEDDDDDSAYTLGLIQIPAFVGESEEDVGYELDLKAEYQYTEDLTLSAGWAHFFVGEAFENSYGFVGMQEVDDGVWDIETNDDDIDYLYIQAKLIF